jgi:hypothetical protein
MNHDATEFVKSCKACQQRATVRYYDTLHPQDRHRTMFAGWYLDYVTFGSTGQHGYTGWVSAIEATTGWLEAKRTKGPPSGKFVADFIYEDIISRFGPIDFLITDGGAENVNLPVQLVCEKFAIKHQVTSPYHPQANGMVERSHRDMIDGITKATMTRDEASLRLWPAEFHAALWAYRITTRRTTGFSPYYLVYGIEATLPIDLLFDTWTTLDFQRPLTTAELLAKRIQQFDRRSEAFTDALAQLRESRLRNREDFDKHHRIRQEAFETGQIVLYHNTRLTTQHAGKTDPRWIGPYKIVNRSSHNSYQLAELDGTLLAGWFPTDRLKPFIPREPKPGAKTIYDAVQLRPSEEESTPREETTSSSESSSSLDSAPIARRLRSTLN